MVGQPVCPWLDSLPSADASRRINRKVVLDVQTFSPTSCLVNARSGTFPSTQGSHGRMAATTCAITSLIVTCAIEYLTGKSSDYHFIRRFDYIRASIIYCIT